jgi:hypothetical protein
MGLRRRRWAAVLLFPVLPFLFMIGWVLYSVGKQGTSIREIPRKNASALKKKVDLAAEHDVEMGLLAEDEEEQIAAE